MAPSPFDTLAALYRRSVRLHPIASQDKAEEILSHDAVAKATDALFDGLVVRENSGLTRGFLNDAARHHYLAARLHGDSPELADVISNLAAHLPGVIQEDGRAIRSGPISKDDPPQTYAPAYLKKLDDRDAWTKAFLVARASSMLNRFPFSVARTKAIADAADMMKAQGYRFTVQSGRFEFAEKEMQKIIRQIEDRLACLGCFNALNRLFELVLKNYVWDFGQILFGQRHSPGQGERIPSTPTGLLFNLAIKQSFLAGDLAAADKAWEEAVLLARNFAAMLDLETYTQFDHLGIDAGNLEERLRHISHSDHIFSLRQWDFGLTAEFLEVFFGDRFNTHLKQSRGWDVADIISFCGTLESSLHRMPRIVAKDHFYGRGLDHATLQAIFRDFCHEDGQANAKYRSPFDAKGLDVIFRPFVLVFGSAGYRLLLLPQSIVGPAIFEAVFAAVSQQYPKQVAKLRGDQTEELTRRIFAKHGFLPSFAGTEYELSEGCGECDFVFEDGSDILLVECKAKPLTRDAMTGAGAGALLDFAGGVVASQAQSLRHERLLRTRGDILFKDGSRLEHRNRRITRLTVSLTDQGTLQDRWILYTAYSALLTAQVTCPEASPKRKQVEDFQDKLTLLQSETNMLVKAGHDLRAHRLNAGSGSVAQLEVQLRGVQSLADVRNRIAMPVSFNTGNPLLEHHHLERMRRHAREQAD